MRRCILALSLAVLASTARGATGQSTGRPVEYDLSNRVVKPTGASTARALKDHLSDVANVKNFGAKGDGVTDDAPAFQAAFAAAKTVYAPKGQYLLKSTVSLGNGQTLIGAGAETIFIVPAAGFVGERVITNADISGGNTDITLADFALRVTSDLPVSGTNPGLVRLQRVDGLTVRGIYSDSGSHSLLTFVDLASGIRNAVISGNRIKNGSTVGSGGALWIRGGGALNAADDCYNISVFGNVFEAGADEAFGIYGWFNTISRVAVTGNVFKNTVAASELALSFVGSNLGQPGIVRDVTATGNVIYGKTNVITGATRVTMTGNVIVGPTGATHDAIFVSVAGGPEPTDITISNNQISGAGRYGIFSSGTNVLIRGNRIFGTTDTGIYGGSIVEGNHVDMTGGGSLPAIYASGARVIRSNVTVGGTVGVNVFGATDDLVIEANDVTNASSVGISVNNNGATVSNVSVLRNHVRATSGTTTYAYRSFGAGAFTGCTAEGNRTTVSGTGALTNHYGFASDWRVERNFKSGALYGTPTARVAATYGLNVAIDAALGHEFVVTPTNGNNFTISNPTNAYAGRRISVRVVNTFGALGTLSFGTAYRAAAWTQPANGNSRAIDFQYDGTNWIEVSRTPADVPN